MSRKLPWWIGKTNDAPVPARVRLRIFDAHYGRCVCCNRKIMPGEAWELDHRIPLISGGAHAEFNLRPMLRDHHREKTVADLAAKSKTYRVRSRHIGVRRSQARPLPGTKASGWIHHINGTWERR